MNTKNLPVMKEMMSMANMIDNAVSMSRTGLINPKRIRNSDYTATLLNEALNVGKITESDINSIQARFMDALTESISIYTHDESTSVMVSTANMLMMSLVFNVDAYLISIGDADESLDVLMNTNIKQLYYMGMKQLKRQLYEAAGLLAKVRSSRIKTPCLLYNQIIDKDVMSALKSYDIPSASHLGGKFDYPLSAANTCANMRGIYYIKTYLFSLYTENCFCKEFELSEISALYETYCDFHNFDYKECNSNIYDMVLLNAVFAEYLQKDTGTLVITLNDCEKIRKLLSSLSQEEQSEVIYSALNRVNYGDRNYNRRAIENHMTPILNAVKHNALSNYLAVTRTKTIYITGGN